MKVYDAIVVGAGSDGNGSSFRRGRFHESFRLAVGDTMSVSVSGSYDEFKNLLKQVSPQEANAIDCYQESLSSPVTQRSFMRLR